LKQYPSYTQKVLFILGFLGIFCMAVAGQSREHLDSLEVVYKSHDYKEQDELKILRQLAQQNSDLQKKLVFSEALIQAAGAADSGRQLFAGFLEKGKAFNFKGEPGVALENFFKAAEVAVDQQQLGTVYITIADVYSNIGNQVNGQIYYKKAILIMRSARDTVRLAAAVYNAGDGYLKVDNLDSALAYTNEAKALFTAINDPISEAFCLGNIGKIYAKRGDNARAEQYLNAAIQVLQESGEYSAICEYWIDMSAIYLKKGETAAAQNYAFKSLTLAQQYGLKKELSEANRKLSELYESAGEPLKSLAYYKEHIKYRDSVSNIATVQKMADLRTDFEVSEKQKEVDLLATRNKLRIAERNGFIFASLLLATILTISIYFYTQKAKRNKLLTAQKMQEAEIIHQKDLLQSVITSQEAERKRIGMDLHDEVGAALSTLRIKIEQHAGETTTAPGVTENYKSDIDKIIANMRNISHSLSPRIAGNFGFYDAIHELSDGINRSGKINMLIDFDENKLPVFTNEEAPMALYRVMTELVNNTLKHASAQHIQLTVTVEADTMEMTYSDDGIGIAATPASATRGMGMQNIESRLGIIGATWAVYTPETGGYGVHITVPLK
jgi:signal transduction histidine kinase